MQLSEEQIIEIGMRHFREGHSPTAIPNFVAAVQDCFAEALRAQADARPVAWSANWIRDQIADQIDMWPLAQMTVWQIADHVRRITITHPAEAAAPGLSETVEDTIKTIERQLELIAERAPGNYLDKRPVVQSLNAHIQRLRKALTRASAATVDEPSPFKRYTAFEQAGKEASERTAKLHEYLAKTSGEEAAQHQAEPGADEREEAGSLIGDGFVLEFERWNDVTGALPRNGSWLAEVSDIIQRAAQSGQRAGVAEPKTMVGCAECTDEAGCAWNRRCARSSQGAGIAEEEVRNAARYRWLRERRFYKADNPHTSMYHKGGCDTGWLYLKTLDRNGLDAAIDAAIAAARAKPEHGEG